MNLSAALRTVLLAAAAVSALPGQQEPVSVDNFQMRRIIQDADFDFINYTFYADEEAWKGKVICVSGSFVQQPVIGKGKRNFVQLSGRGSNGPVNIIIHLDNDLTTQKVFGNDVPVLTNGMQISAFVQLTGAANFVNSSGSWFYLPTADGLLFYAKDDAAFRYPLWASRAIKR